MQRRVVITGLGCFSGLGADIQQWQQHLYAGQTAIKLLDDPSFSQGSVRIGAPVSLPSLENIPYDLKVLSRLDPFLVYGIIAGIEAVESSLLFSNHSVDLTRVGVSIGSGIGGLSTIEKQVKSFEQKGSKSVSPFFIPSTLINLIGGHLSIKYGFLGPNVASSTACVTSLHAILQAFDLIQNDYADVMIAGGSEHAITPLGIAGFAAARALSTANDHPQKASRPFDQTRNGFVMGDGAALIVIEELEHALARNATIYAEILSGSYTGDAYHITQPHPEGLGARLAMTQALKRAKLEPDAIDALSPHATSTPIGDLLELQAIQNVFGDNKKPLWLFPIKGATGHMLGASGAMEVIASVLALHRQELPPALNLDSPEPLCAHFQIPQKACSLSIQRVMSNSFAFGGANASIILERYR